MRILIIKRVLFFSTLFILSTFLYVSFLKIQQNDIEIINFNSGISQLIIGEKLLNYKTIHDNIIRRERKSKILFSAHQVKHHGYANKCYALISSFLIAILSDSAIFVHWDGISNYIEPVLEEMFEVYNGQNEFNINFEKETIYHYPGENQNTWSYNKNLSTMSTQKIYTQHSRAVFTTSYSYFFELCSNPIYYDKIRDYDLVSDETIKCAVNSFANSSISEKEKQDNVFQVGFEVAGNIMNKLWIPKPALRNYIDLFRVKYLRHFFIIGIQIRTEFLSNDDVETILNCAGMIRDKYLTLKRKIKFYISSDSEILVNDLEKKFVDDIITSKTLKVPFRNGGLPRSIIDIELLSLCDELVVTGGSTYGFLAAIKSGALPYYVDGKRDMNSCKIMRLSEPSRRPEGYAVF